MLRFLFTYSIFFGACLIQHNLLGQRQPNIEIIHKQINFSEYQVFAINKEKEAHSVIVDYMALRGLKAKVELPYISTVEPGETPLFKLELTGTTDEPGFTPLFQFREGPLRDKFSDFPYALPTSVNTETLVFSTIDTADLTPDKDFRDYIYSLLIFNEPNDTVFAARDGKVLSVEERAGVNLDSDEKVEESLTSMKIEHNDGSIGHYINYSPIRKIAKEGSKIRIGDPLGLGPTKGHTMFYVQDEVYDPDKNSLARGFLFINFKVDENDPILILDSAVYQGYITEEMITWEMSKKERRRYFRKKKD